MILDASVLAKLFIAEDLSDRARELIAQATEISAPAHSLAELGEILSRKITLGQVRPEQSIEALSACSRLVRLVPLDGLVGSAVLISQELGLSVYDTLYLALAEAARDVLITWDKRLLRLASGTRFAPFVQPLDPEWAGA